MSLAPQSAQLNAVRKLIHARHYQEADARLAELRTRYPAFKPLLPLAWEVADMAGDFFYACLHAWDWSVSSPNSQTALEALRDSASAAPLPALATMAAQKLAHANGTRLPDPQSFPGPLGPLTFDQAVAIDLGQLFMTYDRFSDAVAALEGIDHPAARNDLAIARFGQGDVAAALAGVEAAWRSDESSLFALQQLVRLTLWASGYGPAAELGRALCAMQPRYDNDAYGKMFTLLVLGAHDDAIAAWQAMSEAGFWMGDDMSKRSSCAYFAGLSALRQARPDVAGKFFLAALRLHPGNLDAGTASIALTLGSVDGDDDLKAGAFADWFPRSWLTAFKLHKGAADQDIVFDAHQRGCDAHEDYLATAAEVGGRVVRIYALSILKSRALNGNTTACDRLRKLLVRPCGPDQIRLDLALWLNKNNLVEAGHSLEVLQRGEVRAPLFLKVSLHGNKKETGLPAASQARLVRSHHLLQDNNLLGALQIAEALVARHPGFAILVTHVAHIKDALGHDIDEIEPLFQRAATLDPGYLFAQIGLSRIAVRKGMVTAARNSLMPLLTRSEYHFTEWRALLYLKREIAVAEEDHALIGRLDETLADIDRRFG